MPRIVNGMSGLTCSFTGSQRKPREHEEHSVRLVEGFKEAPVARPIVDSMTCGTGCGFSNWEIMMQIQGRDQHQLESSGLL